MVNRPFHLAFLLMASLFSSCGKGQPSGNGAPEIELSSHPRAAAAARNVRRELEDALAEKSLKLGDAVFLRAFKEERRLEVFMKARDASNYVLFRTYPIAAASGTLGPKLREGDGQVPEGFYFVPLRAMNPNSRYHLSFNIGFPNAFDRSLGRTGSHIMIHGNRVSIGCLAMTDAKIEEIFTLCDAALRNGQPFFRVHLFPFRMTGERMAREEGNANLEFWRNLKEGYDLFERENVPPEATAKDGRYEFGAGVEE